MPHSMIFFPFLPCLLSILILFYLIMKYWSFSELLNPLHSLLCITYSGKITYPYSYNYHKNIQIIQKFVFSGQTSLCASYLYQTSRSPKLNLSRSPSRILNIPFFPFFGKWHPYSSTNTKTKQKNPLEIVRVTLHSYIFIIHIESFTMPHLFLPSNSPLSPPISCHFYTGLS